ncbi:hypothetical protein Kpol_364p3 [Vanderwaltozyma polyspora DSM 70294]|uniref:ATP synthase F(0) complex subunit e, mitochondrial n=1 Tax=Vanderwaltozyma polyspora (strain ATCC 22028 / DSM 70294 / BCRC 21397 / CBS 2163 / NBRC 10782 / NRRL Y-8283 / UCD 57-17) TaxID=436907 RepID=A7TSB9_VANPO|nr:uncharacterized protein Kpol_364p3 [Vanderwaltozyma polyspora DSM 70294]EDO14831.1 hypothetical protein Kpol_364p3 [Vanderwaltozyma polyspora DSM 70294]
MSTVNVLRYSALGLGLIFGLKNDLVFRSDAKKQKEEEEYQRKLKLVEEAKKEYARLHPPKETKSSSKVNWEDPALDYGSAILKAVETLKN